MNLTSQHLTAKRPVKEASVHIDAIRGAAAFVVLFGHARGLFLQSIARPLLGVDSPGREHPGAADLTNLPHQAVIVFFVLSGYLVGGSVLREFRNGTWSWSGYLFTRLTRLWTVLLPALLLGGALDLIGLTFLREGTIYASEFGSAQGRVSEIWRLSPLVALGNVFFIQTIYVPTFGSNSPLWSLANEFWYYLLFPAIVFAVKLRRSTWQALAYASAVIGTMLLLGSRIDIYFATWLVGAAAASRLGKSFQSYTKGSIWAYSTSFLIINVLLRKLLLPIEASDAILALSMFVLLCSVARRTDRSKAGLYPRIAQFASRISYSSYVFHAPMLTLLCAILLRPWRPWSLEPLNALMFVLVLGFSVLYSYGLYVCFEGRTDALRSLVLSRFPGLKLKVERTGSKRPELAVRPEPVRDYPMI